MKPTDEDLRRVLHNGVAGTAMPSFKLLSEGEIGVCLRENEACGDATLTGANPRWKCATLRYNYQIPGIRPFLPGALNHIPLSAQTIMRSFREE